MSFYSPPTTVTGQDLLDMVDDADNNRVTIADDARWRTVTRDEALHALASGVIAEATVQHYYDGNKPSHIALRLRDGFWLLSPATPPRGGTD